MDKDLRRAADAFAYEPDRSLRELVGKSTVLTDIFTPEKIANCQKMVEDAKSTFFDTSKEDMDRIAGLVGSKEFAGNYQELCKHLFQPVSNIKGQAEIFGFALIARVCRYLIEYCEVSKTSAKISTKDAFILSKLVEALLRTFQEKIVDAGGEIEKELMRVIDQARK